jgi:hypothetical protein
MLIFCSVYCLFYSVAAKPLNRWLKPKLHQKPAIAADVAPADIFHDQTLWLLGYFNPEQLTHYPYSTWYLEGI